MSKYSGLPDIDDQPDVFETPDVDESTTSTSVFNDQSSDEDDGNENVVRSRVSVKEASARFKDSVVDSTETDFSDRLSRRKKAMYKSYTRRPLETTEYELLPKELELQETALQKLRRLMYEVQELNEQVEKSQEPVDGKIKQEDFMSQITYLQNDLSRLSQRLGEHTDEEIGSAATYGKRIDEAKQLIKQLEAYKSLPISTKVANEENDDTVVVEKNDKGDVVTYELYYTPETAKLRKESKLTDIDERIAKLESLIGTSSGHSLDGLPPTLATSSVVGALTKLEQQITILAQPRQLETVARRLKILISELDKLNELKSGRKDNSLGFGFSSNIGSSLSTAAGMATTSVKAGGSEEKPNAGVSTDTEEKVNQLFTTMEKVDPLLNLTPALLTRLKALQGLHSEAATFSQSVKVISEEQVRITDELKSLASTCDLLNKSLKENEDTVTKNINIIDERMADLVKRVGALTSS
ncbi:hypothetical protein VTP01DRAFT_1625 [Rhizomucor pusillus]|uniref:uncharacterized protein n=1 Tax=Rhizomucor pusillus TaxID=4840 RepID=UPI00374243DE